MTDKLARIDIQQQAMQNQFALQMHSVNLTAEVSALAAGDYKAHTALISAKNKQAFAMAVAQGLVPGVGVGAEMSHDGLSASEWIWGAPVTLPNGRQVPFFCGVQELRGAKARFEISNGKMYLYYKE
ncbi:MAG: hypothetical protein CMI52_00215 [Parcubacteria group bacterium]|nr:hypothetical protein [Parcubacteria group bacterium]